MESMLVCTSTTYSFCSNVDKDRRIFCDDPSCISEAPSVLVHLDGIACCVPHSRLPSSNSLSVEHASWRDTTQRCPATLSMPKFRLTVTEDRSPPLSSHCPFPASMYPSPFESGQAGISVVFFSRSPPSYTTPPYLVAWKPLALEPHCW